MRRETRRRGRGGVKGCCEHTIFSPLSRAPGSLETLSLDCHTTVFTRTRLKFFRRNMAVSPLPPLVPPLRYCLVEEGLYRGAYPSLINLRFLTRLGLRSMVSLLPEPPAPHLTAWCEEHGIRNHFECVKPFSKDEVTLTHERAASLLQLLVLPERQPVYVHCLDGVGVTGLLIMCLRKVLHWAPPSIFAEFSRFARDAADTPLPPPPHVLAFLHAWKPELEFLPQYLPAHPPLWLELALQVSAVECRRVPSSAVECRRVPLSAVECR
jgi:tyrosine-protein phosphatase OCA6